MDCTSCLFSSFIVPIYIAIRIIIVKNWKTTVIDVCTPSHAFDFFFGFPVYKTPGLTYNRGQNIYSCDYNSPPPKGMVCDVDVKAWGPCIEENNFNYHKSAPCVILKLNKIFGWVPEYYNDTNSLPEKMPEELKNYIRNDPEIVANPAMVSLKKNSL